MKTSWSLCLVALSILVGTGCRTAKAPVSVAHPKPPITSIRVGEFQCDNSVTGKAVRNVFIEMLALRGEAKVIREGAADVVIEGTVTTAQAASTSSRANSSQGSGGDYVSGVTAVAMREGDILTSASWGQIIASGRAILPPESVAKSAADRLLAALFREGLGRRAAR